MQVTLAALDQVLRQSRQMDRGMFTSGARPASVLVAPVLTLVIPVTEYLRPPPFGQQVGFVAKFDATGSKLQYATYIGGSVNDQVNAIALDGTGALVATGGTSSSNCPTVNAVQATFSGNADAFVFKLNSAGDSIVYSTLLGATSATTGYAIAVDSGGNGYVTGVTYGGLDSSTFNEEGAFVVKLTAIGTEGYSSLVLPVFANADRAITVDSQGAAYVCGGSNIPGSNAFVLKVSEDGTTLWTKLIGSDGTSNANAIARDSNSGIIYVAGQTTSTDLPVTTGVVKSTSGGGQDGFIAGITADGSKFTFLTYLGGSGDDNITAITLTSSGLVIAGTTASSDFPIANALQPVFPGNKASFYSSSDSGATWSKGGAGLPDNVGNITSLSQDPSNPGTIVAIIYGLIYRTTNSGASWSQIASVPSGVMSLSRSLSDPSVLYAANPDGSVYRSTNGGADWVTTSSTFDRLSFTISVSPSNPNTVLAVDQFGNVNKSTDGGSTFPFFSHAPRGTVDPYVHPHTFNSSPDGSMYVVANEGIYRSRDEGATWTTRL